MHRDPNTGKFVSGSSDGRPQTFSGTVTATVPAADLSGGTVAQDMDGTGTIAVNMSDFLDSDEVFDLAVLDVASTLSLPTTATAESSAQVEFNVTPDVGERTGDSTPSFYGGPVEEEEGFADLNSNHDDSLVFYRGRLASGASVADTVNGLGAGAAPGNEHDSVNFRTDVGWTPGLDEQDEVAVPFELMADNISDHAIVFTADLLLMGTVRTV